MADKYDFEYPTQDTAFGHPISNHIYHGVVTHNHVETTFGALIRRAFYPILARVPGGAITFNSFQKMLKKERQRANGVDTRVLDDILFPQQWRDRYFEYAEDTAYSRRPHAYIVVFLQVLPRRDGALDSGGIDIPRV